MSSSVGAWDVEALAAAACSAAVLCLPPFTRGREPRHIDTVNRGQVCGSLTCFARKLALDTARAGVIARGAQTNGAVALYHKSSVPPPAIWRLRSHWAAVSSLPNNLEVWVAVGFVWGALCWTT